MKITQTQVEVAYKIASQVYDKKITQEKGASSLHANFGLNINSARDFINDYKHLINGNLFQRAMSAPAMNYFLDNIALERGFEKYHLAISALEKHIEYYEKIRKVNLNSMRKVLTLHKISNLVNLESIETQFQNEIRKSISDLPYTRLARLATANKKPTKIAVITYVFIRNPDVVAQVISRAKGKCEYCYKSAPFLKKKDGVPFLEVHHKTQLSQGGEDSVENAIALCPNCHRELHYGI